MKTEHKYAQVLRWIADGESVQFDYAASGWTNETHSDALRKIASDGLGVDRYRLKPRTIKVNGREIVAGETVQPEHGKTYYMPITHTEEMYGWETWKNQDWHMCVFQRGLVHLTKENAIAHAKAILGID